MKCRHVSSRKMRSRWMFFTGTWVVTKEDWDEAHMFPGLKYKYAAGKYTMYASAVMKVTDVDLKRKRADISKVLWIDEGWLHHILRGDSLKGKTSSMSPLVRQAYNSYTRANANKTIVKKEDIVGRGFLFTDCHVATEYEILLSSM